MIVDFKCQDDKCDGVIQDQYYPSLAHVNNDLPNLKCPHCGKPVVKCFGSANVRMGGEVPGYEKSNENHLTLGKAIDGRQKWV